MGDEDNDRFNLKRKIFVGNISYRITQKRLTRFFSKFGEVEYCYMVTDHIRKRPRGIGFVTFRSPEGVVKALEANEEALTLDGRLMRVSYAEESSRVKHVEGTVWDSKPETSLETKIEELSIDKDQDDKETSNTLCECHINKLCDDSLILILSMLPWKQRLAVERVCKRWCCVAKNSWQKQTTLNFQGIFNRFAALTDTKLTSLLVRCGPYLKSLDLSASPRLLSDISMDVIAEHCQKLEELDLSGVAVTDISLKTLGKKCKNLKVLSLHRCFYVHDKGLHWLFENCKEIEELNLQGNSNISGNCFQKIGPNCRKLILSDCCRLTDTGLMKICRHCPGLKELHLNSCLQQYSEHDRKLFKIAECLKNLSTLHLEKTLTSATYIGLCQLVKLTNLTNVNLAHNQVVYDEFLSYLAIRCPNLQTLNISSCHTDVTGTGVMALAQCSNLTSLDISYIYKVDDESIQVLSRTGKLRSLTARACSGLSDYAFEDLPCLCPDFTFLDVSGCFNVSSHLIGYFKEAQNVTGVKDVTLCIGGTGIECEEQVIDRKIPGITLCLHDLSQVNLRADRDIILYEPDTSSDEEEHEESASEQSGPVPAGAECGLEYDDEWDDYENSNCHDDLLDGDDPLEMERFELS